MKHMKKSLFFTTVMMVVLLVVALSTATFAWYTSSNTVNSGAAEVSSAKSEGANIAIGWTPTASVGSSLLTFAADATPFNPMVPISGDGTALTAATFLKGTLFNTANLNGAGKLYSPTSATPYVGKDSGSNSVFYVVNYALNATNISFTASVTGDNADRLRVAVFEEDTGKLIYLNKTCYTGTITAAKDAVYGTALTSQPADWADNFGNNNITNGKSVYSTTNTNVASPSAVAAVAPKWMDNTYYSSAGVLQTTQPGDWTTNYATYSSAKAPFTAVVGVAPSFFTAPVFAANTYSTDAGFTNKLTEKPADWDNYFGTYFSALNTPVAATSTPIVVYKLALAVAAELVASETLAGKSEASLIALSNGTLGVARGYIVKVWFDGPTQVDAHGGKKASFTLTAQATNVAP